MKIYVSLGAIFCFLGVLAGALGSHALKNRLFQSDGTALFNLATDYMFYHGLGLLAAALLKDRYPKISFEHVCWLFIAGSILFQGNLYLLSTTGASLFSALTPLGGICLLIGWILFAVHAIRIKN